MFFVVQHEEGLSGDMLVERGMLFVQQPGDLPLSRIGVTGIEAIAVESEAALFSAFIKLVEKWNPDMLVGLVGFLGGFFCVFLVFYYYFKPWHSRKQV